MRIVRSKLKRSMVKKCEFNALPNNNYSGVRYLTHIQSKTKVNQFVSQIAKKSSDKNIWFRTKIQIQLDLHLQRSMRIGASPNINGRGSIALLKRPTKSKSPNSNQTYQLFIYYQTMKLEILNSKSEF